MDASDAESQLVIERTTSVLRKGLAFRGTARRQNVLVQPTSAMAQSAR